MARVASIGKNRPDLLLEELQHCGINSGAGPFSLCFEILKVKEEWEETNGKGPGAKPDHDYHPTSIIGLKVQCKVVNLMGFSCWKSCKEDLPRAHILQLDALPVDRFPLSFYLPFLLIRLRSLLRSMQYRRW